MEDENLTCDNVVDLFNEQLKDFIEQIIVIIKFLNDDKTLSISLTYNNYIKTAISCNKVSGIETFSGYIFSSENQDFTKKISERDINYFNNINFENQASNNLLDLIKIIRNIVPQLGNANQEKIFSYLDNLCTLSNIYTLKTITNK